MRKWYGFLVVLALSCPQFNSDQIPEPSWVPDSASSYSMPSQYWSWWRNAEACVRMNSNYISIPDIRAVHWFVVGNVATENFACPLFGFPPTGRCVGWWSAKPIQSIYVAGMHVHDSITVEHEMTHFILDKNGVMQYSNKPHHILFRQCNLE